MTSERHLFTPRQIALLAVGFLVLNLIWLAPWFDALQLGFEDEGSVIGPAHDILAGKMLYRDLFQWAGPNGFALTALWLAIFGEGVHQARWLMATVSGVQSLLTCLVTARCVDRRSGILAGLAYCFAGVPLYAILNYHWFAGCVLTATVLAWISRRPLLAGFLLGVTGLTLQTDGVAGVLGLGGAWLVVRLSKGRFGESLSLTRACLGLALGAGLPLAVMLALGILPDFYRCSFQFVFQQYADFGKWPYKPFLLNQVAGLWNGQGFGAFANAARYVVNYTLFFLWPLLALLRLRHRPSFAMLSVLGVLAGQAMAVSGRMSLHNLHYLFPLWLVCLFQFRHLALGLLLLLVQFMAGLQARLEVRSDSAPVTFPNGETLRVRPAWWAPNLQAVIAKSNEVSQRGEAIFVFPNFNNLYMLLGRTNPTGYYQMIPLFHTPQQIDHQLEAMRAAKVKVIFDQQFDPYWLAVGNYPGIDAQEFARHYVLLQSLLSQIAPVYPIVVPQGQIVAPPRPAQK